LRGSREVEEMSFQGQLQAQARRAAGALRELFPHNLVLLNLVVLCMDADEPSADSGPAAR